RAAFERKPCEHELHAAADGSTPQEPVMRGLPRAHGPARVLARELRRARQVADGERRGRWRRVGGPSGRHALPGHQGTAAARRQPSRRLRPYVHAEAARVRHRPEPRCPRSAGGAPDCTRRGESGLSLVVDHRWRRDEHTVYDEHEPLTGWHTMLITRK